MAAIGKEALMQLREHLAKQRDDAQMKYFSAGGAIELIDHLLADLSQQERQEQTETDRAEQAATT